MSNHQLSPVLDFLRRHAPFHQMVSTDLEYLAFHLEESYFTPGETVLFPEGGAVDRLFIIKQGRIRGEARGQEPEREDAWELETGESFPIGALVSNRPVRMVQRAVEDTFLLELPKPHFDELYRRSPAFQRFCSRSLASLLDEAMRGVQRVVSNQATGDISLNTQVLTLIRRRPPVCCLPHTPLREALIRMKAERVASMVVVDEEQRPLGVFTLHDLLGRVVLPQVRVDRPIREAMTPHPVTVPSTAFAHQAALVIAERGFGHVCVVDEEERLVGVVSERDIFSLQRVGLVNLSRSIPRAANVPALAALGRDVHRLIDQMLVQGGSVEQITDIITLLNDHLTRRAIELALADHGDPGIPFTWLGFGSEGRREQTLKTDQDNGILFQTPEGMTAEEARARLLPLARRINDSLDAIGFPLCKGDVMASNPEWLLSYEEWQGRFGEWIRRGDGKTLARVAIFFDFRPVWGDPAPAERLRAWLLRQTRDDRMFLKRLAENALGNRPPLGLVRDFVVRRQGDETETLDLRLQGVTPFIDAARVFALSAGIDHTNTRDRLCQSGAQWEMRQEEVDAWVDALHFIQFLRLRRQDAEERAGKALTNRIDPYALNDLERRILKESFRQARKLQGRLEQFFQF